MRHNMKTKSQLNIHVSNKTDSSPLAKKFRVLKEVPREMTPNKAKTKEETTSHLIKLKEEWRKLHRNRDSTHIKMLLRETLDYRDEFLRSHANSLLKDLVEEFPCFSDALYVSYPNYVGTTSKHVYGRSNQYTLQIFKRIDLYYLVTQQSIFSYDNPHKFFKIAFRGGAYYFLEQPHKQNTSTIFNSNKTLFVLVVVLF